MKTTKKTKKSNQTTESTIEQVEAQIVEQSKKIDFYLTEYSIELLATKMKNGEFFVPSYQRKYTWEPERKSKFIESLVMGLPIPFLFFWENPATGALEIVDGSQRLRTIEEYIFGGLKLTELNKMTHLAGLKFTDLLESRQRKIKNRSIRGIVLNEHADAAARFDLFERINTGSKSANFAEVRRGALAGPFMDLVVKLSEDETFVRLSPMSSKDVDEREREELVLRFFAYTDGLDHYKDNVSEFLYQYADKMNKKLTSTPRIADSLREKFEKTMTFVEKTFPFGFARSTSGKTTPRSRFEAVAIGSFLALEIKSSLSKKSPDVSKWFNTDEFKEIIGADGANVRKKLNGRIEYVRDKLLKA